jgi:hypothetical protein
MASVISENLRIYNAEQFRQSIIETGPTNVYLTIGKIDAWANEASPPQANSSISASNDIWKNMEAAKLIVGSDVRHGIVRYDWSANTVYPAYDHCTCSLILFQPNTPFYVLTTDWNIYKCLYNNNGANSIVMPTQTITDSAVQEQDGYIWKYMYTLTNEEKLRFVTATHIPVRTLTVNNNSLQWQVQENATPGSLDVIQVTNGGSGYMNENTITVTITGDGVGASAKAAVNTQSNTVSSIAMISKGHNYTYADIVITDTAFAGGIGAGARAIISPQGGHGSDPLHELGGAFLIINPRLNSTESGKISINNQYREIALIQDPIESATGNIAANTVYSQTLRLVTSAGAIDFVDDEIVYQGASLASATFTGLVTRWDSANNYLELTTTEGNITSDILSGITSGASRYVESVTNKELNLYSGNLLYIDYIPPIQRAADQTEDFKFVLQF